MWAVGGLEVDEVVLVDEHLATCTSCREEADELEGVARLLSTVDLASIDEASPVAGESGLGATAGADSRPAHPAIGASERGSRGERTLRRFAVAVGTVAASVALVASVVAASAGSVAAPPARSVTLHGQADVRATVALTATSWGSRAVLRETGQPPGTAYTVSMESSSGYSWVAGSYRTGYGSGSMRVHLSCPVSPGHVSEVWVTDPSGRTVLDGYA
jgi:hypothetical protein